MAYVGRGYITKMLPKRVQEFIKGLQFRPENPLMMEPGPAANRLHPGVPRIKGYRNPAPGSRPEVPNIPRYESSDQVFEQIYYSRDTRKAPVEIAMFQAKYLMTESEIKEIADGEAAADLANPDAPKVWMGSDGRFGNPFVKTYDPTGLKSTMTATHEALEASLDAKAPNHLPTPEWVPYADEILAWQKERGLPPTGGRMFPWKYPKGSRTAMW